MLTQNQFVSFVFLFFGIVSACGKFVYSPYVSKTVERNLNDKNLIKISAKESQVSSSFKIAIISDTHDYYSDLEKQVDYINNLSNDIAFVLHTGDATNLGMLVEWETFREKIEQLEVPFLLAIGNHDMLTNGVDIYKQIFGRKLDFSFVFKQTEFFIINNNNWESDGTAPNLSYLESMLKKSSATHKIILGHVQPDDDHRYSESQIQEMKNLIDTYSVKYFINGHNHNYGVGSFATAKRVTVGSSVKGKILILTINNSSVEDEHVSF
ncbi:MAG: metallophosphoesterase [Bacteriovoracaceae bacterium]|jgi:predicted phosphodiesterase|nr:metallophosphoesterase [Bacteriovoracaceae bacterium]